MSSNVQMIDNLQAALILHELHKAQDYSQPGACVVPYPKEDPRKSLTCPKIRLKMARACDAGVDVIEVLMEEFTAHLAQSGFRRLEFEYLRRRAEKGIDHQRKTCGSADVVDLVMKIARNTRPKAPERGLSRKRVISHRIVEARLHLERALVLPYENGQGIHIHRQAERALVKEVVAQATRDRAMTYQQAAALLAIVPESGSKRKKKERQRGGRNVLQLLSGWL